jgi:hypothetical protein
MLLTSVGSGVLVVLMLIPFLKNPKKIVGTNLMFAVIVTITAALLQFSIGNVDFYILAVLLCASIPGVWAGMKLNKTISRTTLRTILSFTVLIAGILLFVKVLLL